MKTLVFLGGVLLFLILVILLILFLGARYMFGESLIFGWIFIAGVGLSLTIAIIYGRIWYLTSLPTIWRNLAKKNKYITLVKEKHWIPIERAGRFLFGLNCMDGKITIEMINPDQTLDGPQLMNVEPQEIFYGLDLFLFRYFLKQGYIYLGLDATEEGTTRVGELIIPKTKVIERDGLDNVTKTPVVIRALRRTFDRYVHVEKVETTDGYLLEFVCLGIVTVTNPYLAWYGLGGKAYSTLDTLIFKCVRSAAEQHTLISMYSETDNGQDAIEQKIASGPPEEEMEKVIGMKTTLSIEGWDDNSDESFQVFIGRVQTTRQETQNELAAIEQQITLNKKKEAELESQAELEAKRALLEIQKALSNKQEYEALLALAGGNPEAVVHIVLKKELGKDYEAYIAARALEKTNVGFLVQSGAVTIKKD